MLSSVQNYFAPFFQPVSPDEEIHRAVKNKDFQKAIELKDQGFSISEKDSKGFSAIDYSVFSNNVGELGSLLTGHMSNQKIPIANDKNLDKLLANDDLNPIKLAIQEASLKILDASPSEITIFVENLLKNSKMHLYGNTKATMPQLLAMRASKALIEAAVDLDPEILNQKDDLGNTILHYAAFNTDESVFVTLVEKGADLFATNSKGYTALSLLANNIKQRDPLNFDTKDILLFLGTWLPTTLNAIQSSPHIPREIKAYAQLSPLVESIISYGSLAAYVSTLYSNFSTKPQKALFSLAFFGTSWIPALNVPIRTYMTYLFLRRAVENVGTSVKHFDHRPFRAFCHTALNLSNAYDRANEYLGCLKVAKYTLRGVKVFADVAEKAEVLKTEIHTNCGAKIPQPYLEVFVENRFKPSEVNPAYSEYINCALSQFESVYQDNLDDKNSDLNFLYKKFAKPLTQEYADHCPQEAFDFAKDSLFGFKPIFDEKLNECLQNYATAHAQNFIMDLTNGYSEQAGFGSSSYVRPSNFSKLSLEERLELIDPKENGLEAALDIIGMSSLCKSDVTPRKLCRDLKKQVSPDLHRDEMERYDALAKTLNAACDIAIKAHKAECTKK